MRTLATVLLTLGAQLGLGAAIFLAGAAIAPRALRRRGRTNRRLLLGWVEAGRAVAWLLPWAAALGLAGFALHGALAPWASPRAFLLLGALPAASSYLLLHAGALERRGRPSAARRQVRLAGELLFLGAFALLVLMWTDLLFRAQFRRAMVHDSASAGLILIAAMIALGSAAFVALLAGLAGKPRPTGHFAALLYLIGLIGAVAAADLGSC